MKIEWTDSKVETVKQWLDMFVSKHDVYCGESVVQSDSVNEDCVDFVAELIDLVEPTED
jgi:hypothetical protein